MWTLFYSHHSLKPWTLPCHWTLHLFLCSFMLQCTLYGWIVAVKHLYLVLFLRHNRLKKHLNNLVEHNPLFFFTGSVHSTKMHAFDTVSFLLPFLKCVSWCSHAQSTQALMAPFSCIKGSLCNPLINSLWPQKRGIMKMLIKAKLLTFAYILN